MLLDPGREKYNCHLFFLLVSISDPGPVLNAALSFDSVSNSAAGGNIDVSLVVSWTPPAVLNGIIINQTVTIQSSDGVVVVTDSSVGVSATTLSLTSVTVNPNAGYFATIRVTNGGGFSETNTSTVTSPEGGNMHFFLTDSYKSLAHWCDTLYHILSLPISLSPLLILPSSLPLLLSHIPLPFCYLLPSLHFLSPFASPSPSLPLHLCYPLHYTPPPCIATLPSSTTCSPMATP